jgi:hypothetical protein
MTFVRALCRGELIDRKYYRLIGKDFLVYGRHDLNLGKRLGANVNPQ